MDLGLDPCAGPYGSGAPSWAWQSLTRTVGTSCTPLPGCLWPTRCSSDGVRQSSKAGTPSDVVSLGGDIRLSAPRGAWGPTYMACDAAVRLILCQTVGGPSSQDSLQSYASLIIDLIQEEIRFLVAFLIVLGLIQSGKLAPLKDSVALT